jgi:hypothetical protein
MAADAVLPRALAPRSDGHPPPGSVILQGLIALVILLIHDLRQLLANMGAVLTLFAALTALGVFRAQRLGPGAPRARVAARAAAAHYAASAVVMLAVGYGHSLSLVMWTAGVLAPAAIFYLMRRPDSEARAEGRR